MTSSPGALRRLRFHAAIAAVVLVVAACTGGPILANPPLDLRPPAPTPTPTTPPADPIPVSLPRDDGPHSRLTEWWYYTGHLRTAEGRTFGFEAVIFRAERGGIPTGWASHVALTDELPHRFTYAQRSWIGPAVDRSPRAPDGTPSGFDLVMPPDPTAAAAPDAAPWRLAGGDGRDTISVAVTAREAEGAARPYALTLDLRSLKPPVLHDGDGFVDFGPAGSSYYYSRTRMAASGTVVVDGAPEAVTGIAWFDHQWGDFVSVGGGGWDWFAINLDNGMDVTLSRVLDASGTVVYSYGTLVDAAGVVRHLDATAFTARPITPFISPRTRLRYELGWSIEIEGLGELALTPTVDDQELDTRRTTGVAYWEGSHRVGWFGPDGEGGGDAYVEMTRYLRLGAEGQPSALPNGTGTQ